jgi:hypothetical protein
MVFIRPIHAHHTAKNRIYVAAFLAAVEAVMAENVATRKANTWTVETRHGPMTVTPGSDGAAIFMQFEHPSAHLAAMRGLDANPHSGKWNIMIGRGTHLSDAIMVLTVRLVHLDVEPRKVAA